MHHFLSIDNSLHGNCGVRNSCGLLRSCYRRCPGICIINTYLPWAMLRNSTACHACRQGTLLTHCLCSAKQQGRPLSCHTLHDHVRGTYTMVSCWLCFSCHSMDDVKHVWHIVVQGQVPLIVLCPTCIFSIELKPAEPPEDHSVFPAQSGEFSQCGRPLVFPFDSFFGLSQKLP